LYLIIALFNFNIVPQSLIEFKKISYQVLPILVLVFVFIFLANLFLDKKNTIKYLTQPNKFKKYFLAIFFGILSSGPIYMWYPLLSDLKKKGAGNDILAIFLYNRAVKIPLIPMIIYYFGLPFLIIMTILMIFFSVISGLIINKLTK